MASLKNRFMHQSPQYAKCVAAGACEYYAGELSIEIWSNPSSYYNNPLYANYPLIDMNWNAVSTYCSWADARLPTEAEWEYAARGPEGRTFPWGNDPPNCEKANFEMEGASFCVGKPSAVGSYPAGASWVGALDMAGNVMEWTADWYGPYLPERQVNPTGPSSNKGYDHVVRGGTFRMGIEYLRTTARWFQAETIGESSLGFRCARGITP